MQSSQIVTRDPPAILDRRASVERRSGGERKSRKGREIAIEPFSARALSGPALYTPFHLPYLARLRRTRSPSQALLTPAWVNNSQGVT